MKAWDMRRRFAPSFPVGGDSDPHWSDVIALLNFTGADGSIVFTDATGRSWTTNGSAQIDTASPMVSGGGAGLFAGYPDYLSTAYDAAFAFAGDFTVEFWIQTTQTASEVTLVAREWQGSPYTGGWVIQLNGAGSGPMAVWCAEYSTGAPLLVASGTGYRDGNPHHIAWVRHGNRHDLYHDGISVANATTSFAFASAGNPLNIATDLTFGAVPRSYQGRMGPFRVSARARYTANFTPPTEAFPDS